MSEIRAAEVAIEWNGQVIAAATSYTLDINGETIPTKTLDSGRWKKLISGDMSWGGGIDGIVKRGASSAYWAFIEHMLNKGNAAVTIALKLEVEDQDKYLTGSAIITGLSKSGNDGEIQTYSATYEGADEPSVITYTVI
jgi:predicted secreted protein